MTAELTGQVRELVEAATGMPGENVMLCATHTHTGPNPRRGGTVKRNEAYMAELPKMISKAVEIAASNQRSRLMCIGTEHEEGLAYVRRFRMENCSEQFGPGGSLKCEGPAGSTDPIFGGIVFKEEITSKPFAVICNYTVHIDVTSGNKISADFPGVMQETLQKIYGDDLIVLYVQGACGNINHVPYLQNDPFPRSGVLKSEQMGRAFAGKAMAIIEKARPSKTTAYGTVKSWMPKYPKNDMVVR